MKYMWEGRFDGKARKDVIDFTSSLDVDNRLALHDVKGSAAHCKMLKKAGILSEPEAKKILEGLDRIRIELVERKFPFEESDEDIHTAVERRLVELIGTAGEKLHTARSRNDQVVLDEKLFLKDCINMMCKNINILQRAMLIKADEIFPSIMPAYTHMQQSQPIVISHYFLAYIEMLERDRCRFTDACARVDVLPSGACACCGTSLDIDREYMAELLGFSGVSRNSLDTVSDRDFLSETLSACVIMMVHLSRFAEDMIIWNTSEFSFVELPDEYCTGSSIMPQKKNPDVLELVRGKAASCIGTLAGLLALQKGLPLSYNRDLQEDKSYAFQAFADAIHSLGILAGLTDNMSFNTEKVFSSLTQFSLATDIAEYLVSKKVPFRQAHAVCGKIVRYCIKKKKTLRDLDWDEWKSFSPGFSPDIKEVLSFEKSVESKKSAGGTSPETVRKEINRWKKRILK